MRKIENEHFRQTRECCSYRRGHLTRALGFSGGNLATSQQERSHREKINTLISFSADSSISCQCQLLAKLKQKPEAKEARGMQSGQVSLQRTIIRQKRIKSESWWWWWEGEKDIKYIHILCYKCFLHVIKISGQNHEEKLR